MKNNILAKVFVAIALAVIAGWLTGPEKEIFGISYIQIYDLISQLFLNALHLVAIPLVSASIILGTARMGAESSFGILGIKTFGFYFLTSSLAVLVGLSGYFFFFSNLSSEGAASLLSTSGTEVTSIALQSHENAFTAFSHILIQIIPSNILAAASQGKMLGLIFFCILFGYFINRIEPEAASTILGFWKGIFQIMMKITHLVMEALPLGVFGLVAKVIATTGLEAISSAALYFIAVTASLFVYSLVVIPLLLLCGGVNPIRHFRAISPALFTAFSTSSSVATLPITLECLEKRAGISNRICSFAIPLGTSLNMSGGALYMCIASLFICTIYGIPLTMTKVSLVALMSLLTSMGIAGIPSASLISVAMILNSIGVPAEGIGLIIAVDRILDMFRTTVNVLGNSVCAALIAAR